MPPKPRSLERLFTPRGIAVVGASPDAAKLSGRPLSYLRRYGFNGTIAPVNPRYTDIDGIRCYPDIASLPDGIDLALILLPAPAVPDALEACGKRGIPFAISVASGFGEAGDRALQDRLVEICERYGTRLVGPNCVGLLIPSLAVTATFSTVLRSRMPRPGRLVLATQSGALGNSLLQSFNDLDIALRAWISTGNEADLGLLDLVEHFIADGEAQLIALFIEGVKDGDRLAALAHRAAAAGKQIVALRAGRSAVGRKASISHTGKLAGSFRVWQDLARRCGLIEVDTLDALLDICLAFDKFGPPSRSTPGGLGILTISGGLGVLMSDTAESLGIPLAEFTPDTSRALRVLLPPQMSVANPVDTALFADEGSYMQAARLVLDDPQVETLILVLTSLAHDYRALAPRIAELGHHAKAQGKRVGLTFLSSSDQLAREDRQPLLAANVLVVPTAERLLAALSGHRTASLVALAAGSGSAATPETFLVTAKVPLVQTRLCRTVDEAVATAKAEAVVLKIVSPDIAHKTEVGGVRIGIRGADAVAAVFGDIMRSVAEKAPGAQVDGIEVQPLVSDGVELIVGCSVDVELGRVLMVGAGGIFTEVLADVAFLPLPTSPAAVSGAIESLRIAPMLQGARGKPILDLAAAAEIIARIGNVFHASPSIAEVDVNPLIVRQQGAVAVDALVVPVTTHQGETP
ncbi:acetate--CoA ligase family protein [Rhodoligotrophos appendicifer]|uniref:acetate--CoA ligase family protein n=1 Tax=Rhodoligotrophos appendicifer TaxID=987056 RepID=UPI001FE8DF70|nr:acetate--CoA ligase family protein [Rhodoligotrophos appendicifer]